MAYSDLLVVERREWSGDISRRYALCPGRTAAPGDLVTLHGDPNIYEVTHTFEDILGEFAEVAEAMSPVFYVRKHWKEGNEFALTKDEEGEVHHGPV